MTTKPSLLDRVDLKDGSVGTLLAEPLPTDSPVALGIVAMLTGLHGGAVIALVSKAKQVRSGPNLDPFTAP